MIQRLIFPLLSTRPPKTSASVGITDGCNLTASHTAAAAAGSRQLTTHEAETAAL